MAPRPRRMQRLIAVAVLISISGALAGCGSTSSFDPTDMFDFFDTKKKLPGQRQPVFPEGVPGLEQGVPKELYKENVEREQMQQQAAPEAAPAPAVTPEKPRASARSHAARPRATAPAAAPEAASPDGGAAAAPGVPKSARRTIRHRSTTVPPPDSGASAPAQQPQAAPAANSPFPAPLPSGSFQR